MDRSETALHKRMDEFVSLCRERSLSVTPQRLAIYQVLLSATDHPSPETVFERLSVKLPSLSLATVYKTLDTFTELGVVKEIFATKEKRYDANLSRHHHAVCEECGRITDVYEPAFDRLATSRRLPGFRAKEVQVQIAGACSGCQKQR